MISNSLAEIIYVFFSFVLYSAFCFIAKVLQIGSHDAVTAGGLG
jgi:hypothetical protein